MRQTDQDEKYVVERTRDILASLIAALVAAPVPLLIALSPLAERVFKGFSIDTFVVWLLSIAMPCFLLYRVVLRYLSHEKLEQKELIRYSIPKNMVVVLYKLLIVVCAFIISVFISIGLFAAIVSTLPPSYSEF